MTVVENKEFNPSDTAMLAPRASLVMVSIKLRAVCWASQSTSG